MTSVAIPLAILVDGPAFEINAQDHFLALLKNASGNDGWDTLATVDKLTSGDFINRTIGDGAQPSDLANPRFVMLHLPCDSQDAAVLAATTRKSYEAARLTAEAMRTVWGPLSIFALSFADTGLLLGVMDMVRKK